MRAAMMPAHEPATFHFTAQKSGAAVKIIRKMGKLERRKIFKLKKSGLSGMEQDSSDEE